MQTLRRKAPDSGKCANGVQKVCSRLKTFRTYSNSTGNTSLVQNDYIHPSVKGHRIIADLVEEAMDDVHKASWSSVQKSANALVRLGCRMFE